MSRVYFDAKNSFYKFKTMQDITLRCGLADTAWVFATMPECVKCGKTWPAPYRINIPKSRIVSGIEVLEQMPLPEDARIVEQAMTVICNAAVGCWEDCRCGKGYNMRCINDCVDRGLPDASNYGPARPGDCLCMCTCTPGCGNKKQYPCRCGRVEKFHSKGCPVGLFKRDSSFIVAHVRERMMKAGRARG